MTLLPLRVRQFAGSLAGRIVAMLFIGIAVTAAVSQLVTHAGHKVAIERVHGEAVISSAVDMVTRLERDRARTMANLRSGTILGANLIEHDSGVRLQPDVELSATLREHLDGAWSPSLAKAPEAFCIANDPFWRRPRTAGFSVPLVPNCWLLTLQQTNEKPLLLAINLPHLPSPPTPFADPLFIGLAALATLGLAVGVARFATAPLRTLVVAAEAFARSIDAPPVEEVGPTDVRRALETFNVMQARVREGVVERTRLLASISHDLQTPLTRLRLRLEQVEDEGLREKLTADLSATLKMIRQGLDLARSSESAEGWSVVNLDTMLSSIAEDAAEFGHPVRFIKGSGNKIRVKPDTLSRCLTNLIDNAVSYGGDAELGSHVGSGQVIISVRDHGPGMSEEALGRAFLPFVRGNAKIRDARSGGTGIGLAIAKAQAAASDGTLTLVNHPAGGMVASVVFDMVE